MREVLRPRTALGAVVVVMIWASGVPASVAAADPPPPAVSAVTIPPGQVDAAVGRLDGIADDLMRRSGVPGMAIAVVHDDAVVYAKGFGVRSVDTGGPVDENTVFELASVSKPLGATVVARAVGAGTVRWDDPVTKHLPGFALARRDTTRQVTIADLYSHRSGLPDHAGDLLEDLGYRRAEILRRLRYVPLTPIRSEYAYTNFGLTAAAVAVARASGRTWEELSRRTLYGPLGMTSTSSRYADYARAANRAALHVKVGDRWAARYTRDADAQSPAGGASSSAADMAKWLRLQLAGGTFDGRRIVASRALDAMLTPHALSQPPMTPDSRSSFYGLGIDIGDDAAGRVRFSHSGGFALGGATTVVMLPSERLGIVVLTNGAPVGLAESVAATFMDLAELGRVQRDWLAAYGPLVGALSENRSRLAGRRPPAHPHPARPVKALVGSYANRFYGRARITTRAGRLMLRLGPHRRAFGLRHWNGDTFSYLPTGENATGISAVTFELGGRRRAGAVRVENLDENGLGTFTRR